MAETAVVYGEDDLWRLLERAIRDGEQLDLDSLRIAGWRPRLLYYPDAEIGRTVTPLMARAIVGFHSSLSKSYAYLVYGQANANLLKQEDRAALEIRMLASDGSDLIETIGEDIGRLIDGLVSKMNGRQVFVLAVFAVLLYFSSVIAREWIHESYEQKKRAGESSERIELSEQETKRLHLVAEALQKLPEVKLVAELAEHGREQLVRAVTTTEHSEVLGVPLTSHQAKTILSKARESSFGRRMDGQYEVTDIDNESPEGYTGILKNIITNQEFSVAINRSELAQADIDTLFDALKQKTTVDALVNAWFSGDKVTSASVVRADPHSEKVATNPPAASLPSPSPPDKPGRT